MDLFRTVVNRAKLTEMFFRYKVFRQSREYRRWVKAGHKTPAPHIVADVGHEHAPARQLALQSESAPTQ